MRKPFFKKSHNSWYVQIDGTQVRLGSDRDEAFKEYHRLMAGETPATCKTTAAKLIDQFLTWTKENRAEQTYDWYLFHCQGFVNYIGHRLRISDIRPFHVTRWLVKCYSHTGNTHKNGACRAVSRAFNWARKQGLISVNPIAGMERPAATSREEYLTIEQWSAFIALVKADDPLHDFLIFLWETGARPHEARIADAKDFDRSNRRIVLRRDDSNAQDANSKLVANATNGLGRILDAREGLVAALAKASNDAVEFARDSQSRIGGLGELQGDRDFQFKTSGLSEAERVLALTKRANDIAQNAAAWIQNGSILGDEKQIENGVRLFGKAQQTGEVALSAAGKSSDAQRKVYNSLRGITTLQISAEQQLIETQKQRFQQIEAERKKQREITDEIKRQTEIALENTGEFDQSGKQFNLEEQLERQLKRQNALKEIATSALSSDSLNAAGALGIAEFVAKFQDDLSRKPLQLQFEINQASDKIKADLAKSFENFKLNVGVNIEQLSEVVGRDLVTPDQVAQAQEEATKLAAEIRKKIDDAMALGAKASDLQSELDEALAGVEATSGRRADPRTGQTGQDANAEFNGITQMLADIVKKGDLTKESLQTVIDKRNEFSEKIEANDTFLGDLSKSFSTGVEQFDSALRIAQQLIEIQKQLPKEAPAALNEQLARLDAVLGKDPAGQFGGAQQAMAGSVSSAQAIATAWERSAAAAERTARAAASGGGSATNQAFGGMMHLAAGGSARGIDTIPAMLSPGEFVMNAKSSRRFYAQLQAMNAGQTPAYREQGGSVTTVGDTNVSINVAGGPTPLDTARETMKLFNRISRQGTGRLR